MKPVSGRIVLGLYVAAQGLTGCATNRMGEIAQDQSARMPGARYVIPLGSLRIGAPPTHFQTAVSQFLFGVEPERRLALVKPMSLAGGSGELFICDGALQAVLKWSSATRALDALSLDSPPAGPSVVALVG